ncbi:hypothetical protein [uncultured Planktosalinus sp.]|uniref:hypothetical protein n=1 Tax=uncultured Planktosalinus sp. TaxID=1810935 RepID=UPI0030DA5918
MNRRKKLVWVILIILLVFSFLGIWKKYKDELDAIDQKIEQLPPVTLKGNKY